MRFLTDHDVYGVTVQFLRGQGHDVVTATECGLFEAEDLELLHAARADHRLLITRDRDFGGLVFMEGEGPGIIYLRMSPFTQTTIHAELERLLAGYTEEVLSASFAVIEPAWHRIRRITLGSN